MYRISTQNNKIPHPKMKLFPIVVRSQEKKNIKENLPTTATLKRNLFFCCYNISSFHFLVCFEKNSWDRTALATIEKEK